MVDKLNKSIDKENEGKENEKDKKTNISWSVGEEELLKKIIKEGFEKAGPLSNAKLSHSVFIDDAPVENWKKTGEGHVGLSDEDMLRILISDQKNLVEACGGLNHLLESPQIFKTFSDGLTTFVEKWGEVHGRESAQELVDPVIRAWMNMAKTETWILWTPGAKMIMDWLRKPTSHMEEYYRLSKISMDEEDVYNSLKALAQANIISDNSFEKAEKEAKELEKVKDNPGKKIEPQYTQFELLSKDLGASKKKRSLRMLRFIALVFGPAFVKALFGNATKDM